MLSVLILTKNEETNVPGCLGSVAWSDDVVVLDSESTDRTCEIALERGARVVTRRFDNWSSHQNWAVGNIEFRHPWVFYLDADERCDATLRDELLALVHRAPAEAAFRVRRKDFFMGRWLKRAQTYPVWIVRVFRPERIRYERLVNPVAIVDGSVGELRGHIIHQPFSHGVTHWFERHNKYSSFEAQDLIGEVRDRINWSNIFAGDWNARRKEIKRLAYKLPGRPFIMLFYLLIVRLGFLDGKPGVYYSMMRAAYELMIDVKVAELRWAERNPAEVPSIVPVTDCDKSGDAADGSPE